MKLLAATFEFEEGIVTFSPETGSYKVTPIDTFSQPRSYKPRKFLAKNINATFAAKLLTNHFKI